MDRILYTKICAWLRCNMPLGAGSTQALRKAETRILGVIVIDRDMGCTDDVRERSAWAFARRYVAEEVAVRAGAA